MLRLKEKYKNEVIPEMKKVFGYKNDLAVPKLVKVIVNVGAGRAMKDDKFLDYATDTLARITGQKPILTKAKKSISAFKLREGDKIGLVVTLRGRKMYDFFERLISIVMPRFRDFHGVRKTSFDGNGNYTLGFTESTVFPEIDPGKVDKIQGFEVSIVTSATDDKSGFALLKALGMPFVK